LSVDGHIILFNEWGRGSYYRLRRGNNGLSMKCARSIAGECLASRREAGYRSPSIDQGGGKRRVGIGPLVLCHSQYEPHCSPLFPSGTTLIPALSSLNRECAVAKSRRVQSRWQ
jgi:hypothetical protein